MNTELCLEDMVIWQLLKCIRPIFAASDISWHAHGQSQAERISVQETGSLFKAALDEIPMHIPEDSMFNEKYFDDIDIYLNHLLGKLETLVDDNILNDIALHREVSTAQK